jgi:two-component system cell cycle sensor histidine kinase/response regulator CckA
MNQLLDQATDTQGPLLLAVEEEAPGGTEVILFVEDEAFVRQVTSEVIRWAGYQVFVAASAAEALRVYDQLSGQVDLLLSDVILPGKSGRELACELRQRSGDLAVLLVSGYVQQVTASEPTEWAEECLPKPFSAKVLLRTVRQVLDRKRDAVGQRS